MTTNTLNTRIQLKNDTKANWISTDITLLKGEVAIETDTGFVKFGDGTRSYTQLPYIHLSATDISGLEKYIKEKTDFTSLSVEDISAEGQFVYSVGEQDGIVRAQTRSLLSSDIPQLQISKIENLQAELDKVQQATHFRGVLSGTSQISGTGSTVNVVVLDNGDLLSTTGGDLVIQGTTEFIWGGSTPQWHEIGDEGKYASKADVERIEGEVKDIQTVLTGDSEITSDIGLVGRMDIAEIEIQDLQDRSDAQQQDVENLLSTIQNISIEDQKEKHTFELSGNALNLKFGTINCGSSTEVID